MRRSLRFLAPTLLVVFASLPVPADPMGPDQFLVLEKEALLVGPPRQVTTGMVNQAEWSPDGKYVLALAGEFGYPFRLPPDGRPAMKSKLVLWKAATGDARQIFSVSRPLDHTSQFAWFARGEAAVVSVALERPVPPAERKGGPSTRLEQWLYLLDARRGVMKPVQRVPERAQISAGPAHPVVLVWSLEGPALQVVRPNGRVTQLPLPPATSLVGAQWLADGKRAWIGVVPAREGKKPGFVIADVTSGAVTVEDQRPEPFHPPARESELRVAQVEVRVGPAEGPRIRSLWLETPRKTEKPRCLIAADAEWGRLSPAGDAVLYADGRGAWVVRPLRIPKEAYFQARLAAKRAMLVSNGKQLGLALHMYAADHNDEFPGQDISIIAALQPYLKNDGLFDGFAYTFGGGRLTDLQNPADVVVGHVVGVEGRALIYADGHVRWEPSAPGPAPR